MCRQQRADWSPELSICELWVGREGEKMATLSVSEPQEMEGELKAVTSR